MSAIALQTPIFQSNASLDVRRLFRLPERTQIVSAVSTDDPYDVKVEPGNAAWFEPALTEMIANTALQSNWDSYGGRPTSRGMVNVAAGFLANYLPFDAPGPSIVPLGDGGLQLEWHEANADVEITFRVGKAPTIYALNRGTGAELEARLVDYERARAVFSGLLG